MIHDELRSKMFLSRALVNANVQFRLLLSSVQNYYKRELSCMSIHSASSILIDPFSLSFVTTRRMTTRIHFDDIDVGESWRVMPSFLKFVVFCCKTLLIQIKVQSEEIYISFFY